MTAHRSGRSRLRRRLISIPALFTVTIAVTVTAPLVLVVAVLADTVRGRLRLPIARLIAFGICWCWIETGGIARAAGIWLTGHGADDAANYRLMAWWSGALIAALRRTIGVDPQIEHLDAVQAGNAIVLSRHASLADSLLSGWVFSNVAGLHPRYVLKRELLVDPCLDVVGLRIPNHFLDREALDGGVELEALRELGATVGPGSVGVIFAEGTRANARKRERALAKIAERAPERAARLAGLRRLLPPRPAGSAAFLEGAPGADVVLAWHTGFDGLDTFGGMLAKLAKPLPPVRFVMTRIPRRDVPAGEAFGDWLDERWLEIDRAVDEALSAAV
ncbi:MAG TPA: 1-acyl-sn-glycerol-3-phosphate acyltransferase [Ilumatobacter sp.]